MSEYVVGFVLFVFGTLFLGALLAFFAPWPIALLALPGSWAVIIGTMMIDNYWHKRVTDD